MDNTMNHDHLAWHETMELHELVAFQSTHLAVFKKKLPTIQESALKALYVETIRALEQNLRELLKFYPMAPPMARNTSPDMAAVEAATLLGFLKTAVRNYAIAITETATPQLRDTFQKQLLGAIALHAKVFHYMHHHGYYPAYHLEQLLANDVKMANNALNL